jgi:hypothetical protein
MKMKQFRGVTIVDLLGGADRGVATWSFGGTVVAVLALALVLACGCDDDTGAGGDGGRDVAAGSDAADGAAKDAAPDVLTDAAGSDMAAADAATTDAAATDAAAAVKLCDGSAGIRLVFVSHGGGPLWPTFSFSGAYGHAFFAIDGTCTYWAGGGYLLGIRTGILPQARADAIARDLHYGDLARLKVFTGRACPDAGTNTISDGTHHMRCTCDCTDQTPAEYREAFAQVNDIRMELIAGGTQAPLPIRIIAIEPDGTPGPVSIWPLSWSPAEVLVTQGNLTPTAGRLVTDTGDLVKLRALRASLPNPESQFAIKVRDAGNRELAVLPRDEAPAAVSAAIHTATH